MAVDSLARGLALLAQAAAAAVSGGLKAINNLSDVPSLTAAALNLAGGTTIAQSAVAVSHTGDTAEFTLATITLPAGAMGANGVLKIVPRFSYAGAGGNRTPRIKFGATTIASAAVAAANLAERYNIEVFNKNSQSSQLTSYDRANTNGSAMANGTAAIDTSAAVTILITGQLAVGTDTITLEGYQVIVYPKA